MTASAPPLRSSAGRPAGLRIRAVQNDADFAEVVRVRTRVFGDEQGLVGPDAVDDDDAHSLHAMGEVEHGERYILVATGRLTLASTVDLFGRPRAQIAWVATLPEWRGRGIASAVMRFLLDEADAMGSPSVLVSAQVHAMGLYRRLGFEPSGRRFESGGITHQLMVRPLRATSVMRLRD